MKMVRRHQPRGRTLRQKDERVTQRVVEKRLLAAWDEVLSEAFAMSQVDFQSLMKGMFDPNVKVRGGTTDEDSRDVVVVVRTAIRNAAIVALKREARDIHTERELSRKIEEVRQRSEGLPTAIRATLRQFAASLPRRGGPGRTPKLTPEQEKNARQHILDFIGQGCGMKAAIGRTAAASPALLGTKVGVRTLETIWARRKTTNT